MGMIIIENNLELMHLYCNFANKDIAKRCGGIWNPNRKSWDFVFTPETVQKLMKAFSGKENIRLQENFQEFVDRYIQKYELCNQIKKEALENKEIDFQPIGIRGELYNFQKHGVRFGTAVEGAFLIADEMGLGKTVQAIAIAMYYKLEKNMKNCLIVCPSSLKYNWLNEINKFTNEPALIVEGTKEERELLWCDETVFFKIVNYEIFTSDLFYSKKVIDIIDGVEICNPDKRIKHSNKILNHWFSMCIVDEIHYIKSHSTLRTRALKKLKVDLKIGLTGTPIDNKLEELHSIFEFLKPGLFKKKKQFLDRYAIKDYFGGIKKYIRVEEVKNTIQPFFLRRLKKNVYTDLPDKIYQDVYVELSEKNRQLYNEIVLGANELTVNSEKVVQIIRARQFCDFPELLNFKLKSNKFEKLQELLDEIIINNGHKVIIFSQYKQVVYKLEAKLIKTGYKILTLTGDDSHSKRNDICKQFNEDNTINIIIMTDAGSVGLNLQSASYVIHYDDNYSPAIMRQRNDRAHRIGQKETVNVIRFICKDTIEERVRNILDKKYNLIGEILDEEYDEYNVGKVLSVDDLIKLL